MTADAHGPNSHPCSVGPYCPIHGAIVLGVEAEHRNFYSPSSCSKKKALHPPIFCQGCVQGVGKDRFATIAICREWEITSERKDS